MNALTRLDNFVNKPKIVHLLRAVGLIGEDDTVRHGTAKFARKQSMRAHAGIKAKHNLWQRESGMPLCDDKVERQERFKPTTEGRTLHQTHGQHVDTERRDIAMEYPAAAVTIADQCITIALADQLLKKRKIAAVAKDIGRSAAEDQVMQRHLILAKASLNQILPAFKIAQHGASKTRPVGGAHKGPQCAGSVIVKHVQFAQRKELIRN